MAIVRRYGFRFDTTLEDDDGNQTYDDLGIEMFMIRKGETMGEKWRTENLFDAITHYENIRKIIWPKLDCHRWHTLCADEITNHKITVLMGCGSSGKTHEASWWYLVDYWCFPEETCVLVSSTHLAGLRKRVWAEISMLWEEGTQKFPKLAGHMLDSAIAITTDNIEDVEIGERKTRDMRKGIFGIPCVTGGRFVGLGKFMGIKQKRMRLIADEASAMADSFLSAFSNLNKNEDFRATILGNPNDLTDPLGRAAEPKEGWSEDYLEPTKTRCWDTRFMNGRCVNLVGLDSPNFDFPENEPTKFKYLISREKIADTLSFFPKDSMEYYSQCVGTMKIGTVARRVVTRQMCNKFGAQLEAKWQGSDRTKVYFVDASYGGDRCVAGSAEFGKDVDGKMILSFNTPRIIPIIVGKSSEPEEQIARFVKQDLEEEDIPPDNMGHDSTGRGALGTALSRILESPMTHPIDSGGRPTERPVHSDMWITDEDKETGVKTRRLKRCDEHYDRLVTEFWFSVRYCIEAGQVRNLPEEPMDELCSRKWDIVKGDKRSVEPKDKQSSDPTKMGMKQRLGKSPDMGDWAAGIVEMARRKGFVIAGLSSEKPKKAGRDWYQEEAKRLEKLRLSRQLQTA